jgi:hypothetical protein
MNTLPKLSPESEVLIALLAQPEKWKTVSLHTDQTIKSAELEHVNGVTIWGYFTGCALFVRKGDTYLAVPKNEHSDVLFLYVLPCVRSVQKLEAEKAAESSAQLLKELQEELNTPQTTQA